MSNIPKPELHERNNEDLETGEGIYHIYNSIHMNFALNPNMDFEANVMNGSHANGQKEIYYQQNYKLKTYGKSYMFEYTVENITIRCESEETRIRLLNATKYTVDLGNINYPENYYPNFWFNITYEDIQVPTYGNPSSNFTLKMNCLFLIDINKTMIKLETIFNLTNFKYYFSSNHTEPATGTPFSMSLDYNIMAFDRSIDPEDSSKWIFISPYTYNTSYISYNLETKEYPITTLYIEENFKDIRDTIMEIGNCSSSIGPHPYIPNTLVASHSFDGLSYGNTTLIISDPTFTLFYDPYSNLKWIIIIGVSIGAVVVISLIIIHLKKKKKKNSQI